MKHGANAGDVDVDADADADGIDKGRCRLSCCKGNTQVHEYDEVICYEYDEYGEPIFYKKDTLILISLKMMLMLTLTLTWNLMMKMKVKI